jgi:hypothetical protein
MPAIEISGKYVDRQKGSIRKERKGTENTSFSVSVVYILVCSTIWAINTDA